VSQHDALFDSGRFARLNDPRRLLDQVSEHDLARLLDLRGQEDVLDLGSGTGFYTDRMASLTSGTVYAVELQPEMIEHYRDRGVPANVRLVNGDITDLSVHSAAADTSLSPASADVACCIATWHETRGRFDLPSLTRILRPRARVVIIDWRRDPDSWASGPPEEVRIDKEEIIDALRPHFPCTRVENLGRFMFAIVAWREGS
jgi:SAM-dependent methyltransferase